MSSHDVKDGESLHAEMFYPSRTIAEQPEITVGLCDVRAADSILIRYDFERDGWVIYQAKRFSWPAGDDICDPEWTEAAFCEAWQFECEEDRARVEGSEVQSTTSKPLPSGSSVEANAASAAQQGKDSK